MDTKFTPGPWHLVETTMPKIISGWHVQIGTDQVSLFPYRHEKSPCGQYGGYLIDHEKMANARLIAAAPELFELLSKRVENAEQRAFEDWLARTSPSGEVEQVQDQWECSSDFSDFCDEWEAERAALAKARGVQA